MKTLAVSLSLLLIVFIALQTLGKEDLPQVTKTEVTTLKPEKPVRLLDASLQENTEGRILLATVLNDSDIPVTLLNMRLTCLDNVHEFLTAQEKQKSGQFVPVRIDIGEVYQLREYVPVSMVEKIDCSLEVLNWSKYGVEE